MAWWFSPSSLERLPRRNSQRIPGSNPGQRSRCLRPNSTILYDGHYVLSANRIYMVGGMNDPVGWDHLDNDARTVKPVAGTAEIDVNDLTNTGTFEARLKIPEGDLVLAIDKFNEFNPCQNGGIVGFLHEHGSDSGCGDNNWPKTFVFLAGWGFGHATLNGKPLYHNYEMHFMITQPAEPEEQAEPKRSSSALFPRWRSRGGNRGQADIDVRTASDGFVMCRRTPRQLASWDPQYRLRRHRRLRTIRRAASLRRCSSCVRMGRRRACWRPPISSVWRRSAG